MHELGQGPEATATRTCQFCGRVFQGARALNDHEISKHGPQSIAGPFWSAGVLADCESAAKSDCGTVISQEAAPAPVMTCEICLQSFRQKEEYDLHMQTGITPIIREQLLCQHCERPCRDQRSLQQHQLHCTERQLMTHTIE